MQNDFEERHQTHYVSRRPYFTFVSSWSPLTRVSREERQKTRSLVRPDRPSSHRNSPKSWSEFYRLPMPVHTRGRRDTTGTPP